MHHRKKIVVSLSLFALVLAAVAAFRPMDEKPKHNFKVLPKDISHDDLKKVMDGWCQALGVKCGFCHAPSADSNSHHLDFASDAKPEKNVARSMYKMTGKINKKYFKFDNDEKDASVPPISCVTCHRGNPHPGEAK